MPEPDNEHSIPGFPSAPNLDQVRDSALRLKIQEVSLRIQEVMRAHAFLDYARNRPLIDELNELVRLYHERHQRDYVRLYEVWQALRKHLKDNRDAVHPVHWQQLESKMATIEQGFAADSYDISAQNEPLLEDLRHEFERVQGMMAKWEAELGQFRVSQKELVKKLWEEDLEQYRLAYHQVRTALEGNTLPEPWPLPDQETIAAAATQRSEAISTAISHFQRWKKLRQQVEEIQEKPFSKSAFEALQKILETKRRNALLLAAGGSIGIALLMVALVWGGPQGIKLQQEYRRWHQAELDNAVQTYLDYLHDYPEGKHSEAARKAIESISNGRLVAYKDPHGLVLDYTGDLQNAVPNGSGNALFDNGNRYEGTWKKGLFEGNGTLFEPDSSTYQGGWHEGLRQGQGLQRRPGGWVYQGGWLEDNFQGKGRLSLPDGTRYEGAYAKGLRQGLGTFTSPKGWKYTGQWKSDVFDGRGALADSLGAYTGEWKSGKRQGAGMQVSEDGSRFSGMWVMDQKQGEGEMTWAAGGSFKGLWVRDSIRGKGVFTSRYRDQYSGFWEGVPANVALFDGQGNIFKRGKFHQGLFVGQP